MPAITAALGLFWNLGALSIYGLKDFTNHVPSAFLVALVFTALGFLPAVVVHASLLSRSQSGKREGALFFVVCAYAISLIASLFHLYSAVAFNRMPSLAALYLLTVGFIALIIPLFIYTRHENGWSRVPWAAALAVFAVSALHLIHHDGSRDAWFTELMGHHSSIPLVLAILYQDFRFAFVDLFLKRALVLMALILSCLSLYLLIARPLLLTALVTAENTQLHILVTVTTLGVVTALIYPALKRVVFRLVDRIILRRADYDGLRSRIINLIAVEESVESIMCVVCECLQTAFTAHLVEWSTVEQRSNETDRADSSVNYYGVNVELRGGRGGVAKVLIPTTEHPQLLITIGELAGGRRPLSEEVILLEAVAFIVARRIDGVRVMHERCATAVREEEMKKLALEAELRALHAQLDPHFLFNALTTIGYLIQTTPEKAFETLMHLTALLRKVLQRVAGDSTTLGEELDLIESYLAIERARFEHRLRVRIDVPDELTMCCIPPLIVQPLIENGIKHAISQNNSGGEICVTAHVETINGSINRTNKMLVIKVSDTGAGFNQTSRGKGIGLSNIEERLALYYGGEAQLKMFKTSRFGTTVELHLPVNSFAASSPSIPRHSVGGARV